MKKAFRLIPLFLLLLVFSLSSCASNNGSYTSRAYKNKSKKVKPTRLKKKSEFKFQLYRYRDSEPISN